MLKTLVDWIQLYRQHHLYISDTYFHRDICRAIQSYMVQMDSSGGASKKKSLYASTGSTNFVASQMTFIGDGSFENSGTESGTVRRIQDKIVHLLPDHHYWQGALFQFSDSSVSGIMEQLILSGFLDCTIPHAMYTIGGKVTKQPFGMTSVRVVVGYVADIIGRDLAK